MTDGTLTVVRVAAISSGFSLPTDNPKHSRQIGSIKASSESQATRTMLPHSVLCMIIAMCYDTYMVRMQNAGCGHMAAGQNF